MPKLSRLWQPRRGLFWQMLFFNLMSSVLAWVMRIYPLNTVGLLLVGGLALGNCVMGMAAAWMLLREPPPGDQNPRQRESLP